MFLIIFKFTSAQGAATDIGKKKETGEYSGFPNEVIERVARCLLPEIMADFENEAVQKRQAQWKAENMLGKKEPSPAA